MSPHDGERESSHEDDALAEAPDPAVGDRGELEELRDRLADVEETLRAVRSGEVDAIVVQEGADDGKVFTLSSSDRPYRNFVENMADGAVIISGEGRVVYANQALGRLTGATARELVGRPLVDLFTEGSRRRIEALLVEPMAGRTINAILDSGEGETVAVLVGCAPLLESGGDGALCLTLTDLTSERKAEAKLAYLAQHDALTGLPNRALVTNRIERALVRRPVGHTYTALLFCDLDGFKNVNDAFGHQVGDEMLRLVAERLSAAVRPEDTVARIGGDEFIVLCEGLGGPGDAIAVASRARAAVSRTMVIGPDSFDMTLSIGVALAASGEQASTDTLLRDADEAMYKAKDQGANAIELFDEQLRSLAASRLRLLSEMRHMIVDEELRLHYQPVFGLENRSLVGVEALVRWQHPSRGLVGPDRFIPFAERSGLVVAIGTWVLHQACHQLAAWRAVAPASRALQMAVNVSGRQLAQGSGLVQSVRDALADSNVDPGSLILEVTESALMDDAEAALRVVNELKELGVKIAIDDFGTGYSSLVYLKRFPVDLLKIDRTFVAGLGDNLGDGAIVHSIVDLAQAFGIDAVAEGIETEGHLEILQGLGCAYGQGYLWSPAVPPAALPPARP